MTLEEALAQPGPLLPAWDYRSRDHKRLCVYRVGAGGAALVVSEDVAIDEREPTNEKLRQAGLRIGGTYSYNAYIWVLDDRGMTVWSHDAVLAEGTADQISATGGTVRTSDVTRVETFVDDDDIGHLGVRVQRKNGPPVTVVEARSKTHELDPTYDAMELDQDLMWAGYFGRELALWLRVPHADEHGKVTNDKQLQILAATRALADKLSAVPPSGEFEHLHQPLGKVTGAGEISLRFAPNPLEAPLRFLELRVQTKSGKSYMGRWIKQGTNAQVATFLCNLRTPHTILINAADLGRKLVEDEYE